MSFSLAPSKRVLQNVQAQLLPEYRTEAFTFVSCLPESVLCLCSNNVLLHLHTNYTEADSVLNRKQRCLVNMDVIRVPSPPEGATWLTVLDVDPKALAYALLSDTGTLLFFKLEVRLLGVEPEYKAGLFQKKECVSLCGADQFLKGASLCLQGRRYFFLQSLAAKKKLHLLECAIQTFELSLPEDVEQVVLDMLQDYGTENNVLGCKRNVVYYKEDPIATVPQGLQVLSVFGTQCEAFQLLIQNAHGKVEWWRWTGSDCEAVVLPDLQGVPIGNLLWF
jgi:hypothetical protein